MSTLSTANMYGSEATASGQSRMELQAKLNGLGGINGRQLDPEAKAKKLREACEGFESIFIQKMWQEMRNAVPKTGILSGREERFWQDMYDQELSKSMTKAGGIGLADMMYEQLSRNLVSASRSAAGPATGGAFVPSAAPLVPEAGEPLLGAAVSGQMAASLYDGEAPDTGAMPGQPGVAQPGAPAMPEPAQAAAPRAASAQPAVSAAPVSADAQAAAIPPLAAPAAAPASAEAPKKHAHKADLGQASGLQMAQKAKREAGDKLGARAVRPAQRQSRQDRQEAAGRELAQQLAQAQHQSGLAQAGEHRPGSAEGLKAALELAKAGAGIQQGNAQPLNLNEIVAKAQAMNVARPQAAPQPAAQAADPAQPAALRADAAEPVKKTVRYSTNIPKKANAAKQSKDAKQAIRMLNVDNVGVNSKQGQGLAAYRAQREALSMDSSQPATELINKPQPIAPLQADQPAAGLAGIPPLAPKNAAGLAATDEGGPVVPPLTAG